MKVLITGGAGFVGSHVAEYYAGKGEEDDRRTIFK
jgi:nucleoside-diphosphate-sugar epimerase